ncbi:MAG: hypothetical protein ACRDAI_04755 [Candidatus Rhabdochlamydia sp.]
MNVDNSNNNQDSTIKSNKQDPIVKSHVENLIEKLFNDPSTNTQAKAAVITWMFFSTTIGVYEKLSLVRGELGRAAIKAGFNSADETAKAGLLQLGGGMIFAGAGIAQGVAGCTKATELAQVTKTHESHLEDINKKILKEGDLSLEGSDITIKVEALDNPVTSGLDEIEEEIFYDAEEALSCKQTKPEEQTEAQKIVEKATAQNKITEEKANKLIEKKNKEYDVKRNLIEAKADRFQGLGGIGQGANLVSQSLADQEKAKASRETIQKEMAQDNQNQIGNTADDLKRKADKITDFDPFRSNSSSLKG